MDFPLDLTTNKFVVGIDEFRQTFEVILKNHVGSFMQSRDLGSHVAIHSSDRDLIKIALEETVNQIPGLSIVAVNVQLPDVMLQVNYKDELVNFNFSVE